MKAIAQTLASVVIFIVILGLPDWTYNLLHGLGLDWVLALIAIATLVGMVWMILFCIDQIRRINNER